MSKSQFHTNLTLIVNLTLKTSFNYRQQTKLREGNVFTPVCQSFCSQEGVWPWALWVCLPLGPGEGGVWQTPPGRHPLDRHFQGRPPPKEPVTEAGGTHPTGMHPCHMKSQTTSRRLKFKFRWNRKFQSFVCI